MEDSRRDELREKAFDALRKCGSYDEARIRTVMEEPDDKLELMAHVLARYATGGRFVYVKEKYLHLLRETLQRDRSPFRVWTEQKLETKAWGKYWDEEHRSEVTACDFSGEPLALDDMVSSVFIVRK